MNNSFLIKCIGWFWLFVCTPVFSVYSVIALYDSNGSNAVISVILGVVAVIAFVSSIGCILSSERFTMALAYLNVLTAIVLSLNLAAIIGLSFVAEIRLIYIFLAAISVSIGISIFFLFYRMLSKQYLKLRSGQA